MALSATPPAGGILSDDHRHAHASVLLTRHLLTANRAWETIAPHLSAAPAKWDALPRTTAASSTPCSGSSAPVLPGATCPRTTDTGIPPRRFFRCQEDGHRARILSEVSDDPDLEWLMIDASYIKVYLHRGSGAAIRP